MRLVGLAVVLVGLFGMHGLANHGPGGMENMPQVMLQEMTAAVGSPVDHLVPAGLVGEAGSLAGPVVGAAVWSSGHEHQGMDMSMAGMCVAVLAVGLFALLLLLRGGRLPRALWFVPLGAFAVMPAGRDPDPPSLNVLSIRRC